jgi:hypothetical protein
MTKLPYVLLLISALQIFMLDYGQRWFSFSSVASAAGKGKESCTTNGIALRPNDNWKQFIQTARPGDTFLLRAGTYEVTDRLLLPSGTATNPITIKPYNCERATIYGDSSQLGRGVLILPGSYNLIAGLHIEAPRHEKLIDIAGSVRNVEFRNNALYGGRADAVSIRGGVRNILFSANDLNSGPAQRSGITSSSGGHVFLITFQGSAVPDGVRIRRNLIRGSYDGDVMRGDDTIAISAGNNVVIEENQFTQNYNIEQVIDIKSRLSRIPVIIRGNVFQNNFLGTRGGQDGPNPPDAPEIIVGDYTSTSALQRHLITHNRFERGVSLGSGLRPASVLLSNNIIDGERVSNPTIVYARVYNTTVSNNTYYQGGLRIGRFGACPIGSLVLKDNRFVGTNLIDQSHKCPTNRVSFISNDM